MLRPYFPAWLKRQDVEFALEVVGLLVLIGLTIYYNF